MLYFNLHAIKKCFTILFYLAEKFRLYLIVCHENVYLVPLRSNFISDARSIVQVESLRLLSMRMQPVTITVNLLGLKQRLRIFQYLFERWILASRY